MLFLISCIAFAEEAQPDETLKTYEYEDWGLSIDVLDSWLYQAGSLPPSSDRPFKPTTDTLSSRDSFIIGTWVADNSFSSPVVRLIAFYTSAGTVERIEGVKDQMMQMWVERKSTNEMLFTAGEIETLICGKNTVICFSMTTNYQDKTYVLWSYLLPFRMTVVQLDGFASEDGAVDIKQVLTDMAASIEYK